MSNVAVVVDEQRAPCCGITPTVCHWTKHKLTSFICANIACVNHDGVLCYDNEAEARWDKLRIRLDAKTE
jgi:hypothetical protein